MNSDTSKLTLWGRVALWLLWWGCRLIAVLPYWFQYYVLVDVIYFVVYKCCRYRVGVVSENLRDSFPEKSPEELRNVRRKFYRHLAEMMVNTLTLSEMDAKRLKERVHIDQSNIDEVLAASAGRNMVAMTAHYGCWEYAPAWGVYVPDFVVVSVYHPLKSGVMNELFKRLRERQYSHTVPMQHSLRFCLNHSEGYNSKRWTLGLICDQNPQRRPDSHWFRFLNRDTLFFDGGEKLAVKLHLPVFYWRMVRTKRGYYHLSGEMIYDGEQSVEPNQITERYVRALEKDITLCPEMWLWSHRRWKHKR